MPKGRGSRKGWLRRRQERRKAASKNMEPQEMKIGIPYVILIVGGTVILIALIFLSQIKIP